MDVATLITELETATFQQRRNIAATVARDATPELLRQVGKLLVHPHESVRLGAIEILAAARFAPALPVFVEITEKRRGQERVFAARAVAALAGPDDRDAVEPAARAWQASGDEFLAAQAPAALAAVGADIEVPEPAPEPPPPQPTHEALPGAGITSPDRGVRRAAIARVVAADGAVAHILAGLRESRNAGVRLDLVSALERLGGAALATAALALMPRADPAIAALLARALARHAAELPGDRVAAVRDAVDQNWRNLAGEALAREALEACLRALPEA